MAWFVMKRMDEMAHRWFRVILLPCLLFAFAVIIRLGCLTANDTVIETDGYGYVRLAQFFSGADRVQADKEMLLRHFPPGYAFGISFAHHLIKDWEMAGRSVSIFCGSLLCVFIFFLARDLYGQKVAILASLLVAIDPILITASMPVLTEMFFSLLLIGSVGVSLYLFRRPNLPFFFVSGMLWGFCYLIKSEAMGYLPIVIFSILSGFFFMNETGIKQKILFAVMLVFGFSLVYLAYLFYCYREIGGFNFAPNMQNALLLLAQHKGKISYEEMALSLNRDDDPIRSVSLFNLLKVYGRNLYYRTQMEILPRVVLLPLWVFIVLGLFRSSWDKLRLKKDPFVLLFILFPVFFYPLFLVHERRFVPILPLVMVFAANGICEFEHWCKESFGHNKIGLFAAFLLVMLSVAPRLGGLVRPADPFVNNPVEYKEVGRWMKDQLPAGMKIMSRDPALAYYAKAQWEILPYATLSEMIAFAKKKQVDYIVFERYFAKLRPKLRFLMDEGKEIPGLKLVYRWDKRPEYKVLVYKLEK